MSGGSTDRSIRTSFSTLGSSTAGSASTSTLSRHQIIEEAQIFSQPPLSALCFRAIDARSSESFLGDVYAADIVDKLGINTSRVGNKPDLASQLMCLRAMIIDVYCTKFMDQHDRCTVLNITTGLDTRFMRLKPRAHTQWVEVDTTEFTELRRQFLVPPPNVLELAVDDLTDTESWVPHIPNDAPTLVIMEAGAWTTPRRDFDHIMNSLVEHLPLGKLVFDVMSRLNALMFKYKAIPPIRMFTFKIEWHCEDPLVLEAIHPKIKFLEKKGYHEATTEEHDDWMPAFYGGFRSKILAHLPGFNSNLRVLFYEF